MNRDKTIRISIDYYNNRMDSSKAADLLRAYCKEHSKDDDKIDLLVSTLFQYGSSLMMDFIPIALEYYEKKFNVIKVIKNNQIIKIY